MPYQVLLILDMPVEDVRRSQAFEGVGEMSHGVLLFRVSIRKFSSKYEVA
jgi:hypothetical protein